MLANIPNDVHSGRLDRDLHMLSTAKLELVGFIADALPNWRDHPERPSMFAETRLTVHLCDFLNSAAYHSSNWSHVQFRTETGDETCLGRSIDLTVKPRGFALIIEGRRHSQFEALFPIECKRLPTPRGKDRDEREYVVTESGSTGGIQRFKLGYHGAKHKFAAIIAYVQEQAFSHWLSQVNGWIHNLAIETNSVWSDSDVLSVVCDDPNRGLCAFSSRHQRISPLEECEVRHLWIRMN